MKKLLLMSIILISLLLTSCGSSSADEVNQTPNPTSPTTTDIVLVPSSTVKVVKSSKSISGVSKSSTSTDYDAMINQFTNTAGNGNDAYITADGYGNIKEFGIKGADFVVVNSIRVPSNNIPAFAQPQNEIFYGDYTTKRTASTFFTEYVDLSENKIRSYGAYGNEFFDKQGRIYAIIGHSTSNVELFEGTVNISNVSDALLDQSVYEGSNVRDLGRLVFTYTMDGDKIKAVNIVDNYDTPDTLDDTTYDVTFTETTFGYVQTTKIDGVTTYVVTGEYSNMTTTNGDVFVKGVSVTYDDLENNEQTTIFVNYTRDSGTGVIVQADVDLYLGESHIFGTFNPKD